MKPKTEAKEKRLKSRKTLQTPALGLKHYKKKEETHPLYRWVCTKSHSLVPAQLAALGGGTLSHLGETSDLFRCFGLSFGSCFCLLDVPFFL